MAFVPIFEMSASAATPPQLNLRILLVGGGSGDPTTDAWQAMLGSEGVPYTLATAAGAYGSETVSLPTLSSGTVGDFNGVVIADSPDGFAAGALNSLYAYESAFGVRQVDGYSYPSGRLGLSAAGAGALDGTTGTLTTAALANMSQLKGPVPFDTGTYGYPATVVAGTPVTPWLTNSAGQVLAAVYQHPAGDAQANVAELSLTFNYNANSLQWLLLGPGLINWVTQNTHLGLYRNYFGQDIDDTFIADNEWSRQYQCTPSATEPVDVNCPVGVQGNPAAGPPDSLMSPTDVTYVQNWQQRTGIKLELAFNAAGACTEPGAASNANCSGTTTINGTTYTDPGPVVDSTAPDSTGLVNAFLANQASFNWINHTWSHLYLGCTVWQALRTNPAVVGTGGSLAAGNYSYEVTAATAYGESVPSAPIAATVGEHGSVSLSWPDATNGGGPTLSTLESQYTGGSGFWGYKVYRQDPGTTGYGLIGQVAENPAGGTATYGFTDTGSVAPGGSPETTGSFPTATNPGIECAGSGGTDWTPATATDPTTSIQGQIGLDVAFAQANGLTNFTPSAVVTGEHSGLENPNMAAAMAGAGITTFASDASRQPNAYTITSGTNVANAAPRYPSNIYYNASNWPNELSEYNSLYVAPGISIGDPQYPNATGHCSASSTTTCLSTPATEASLLASESRIMLGHVLANNPRMSYAHQSNLIGPAQVNGVDYGYTLLTLLDSMLAQYNAWYTTPLTQVTDVSSSVALRQQAAWAATRSAGTISASILDGVVTLTNTGSGAATVPVTVPTGTTVNGTAFGTQYGATLSGWTTVAAGTSQTLTESVPPTIVSGATAQSIVGTAFSFTVATNGAPVPAITETGALPAGLTFTDNGNGTATIAGTPAPGTGGSYPLTITATSTAGTTTQSVTLTNAQAPTITSPTTAAFTVGSAGTYTVTTTGYPAATITETGTLPTGLSFADTGTGTATISGTPAAASAGTYPVTISATNSSGSTVTLGLTITVTNAAAPVITSGATAYFTLGRSGAFAVTATGSPTPAVTATGALPAGLTFTDQGNGTALLQGTPTAVGTADLTVTATNVSGGTTQSLSVLVGQAPTVGPTITSASPAYFTVGTNGVFPVTATGVPTPVITQTGTLPAGLTFVDQGNGSALLQGTPTTSGTANLTVTATNAAGSATQTLSVIVGTAPAITSAATAGFSTGTAGSFTVTTTGYPAPAIGESGTLPSGLSFVDNADGTATIAGTPAANAGGTYAITVTAANHTSSVQQQLTITVDQAPAITSASTVNAAAGKAFSFTVTSTGYPVPTLSLAGTLPTGVVFTPNNNGTATISGTPTRMGTYPLTIRATSTAGTATQSLSLVVAGAPTITSASKVTFTTGTAGSFAVTTTGIPVPSITVSGTLPAGLSFVDNKNGTATLAGTPTDTAGGRYALTVTATNSVGSTRQTLTVTVNQAPKITSASSLTVGVSRSFSFTVTTTGYPLPKLSETGSLPRGVKFAAKNNGTATISGSTASRGTYRLTITATGAGTVTQSFTLTVN